MLKFYCTILSFYLWELAYFPSKNNEKSSEKHIKMVAKYFSLTLLTLILGCTFAVITISMQGTDNLKIFSWILADFMPQILGGYFLICWHNFSIRNCSFRLTLLTLLLTFFYFVMFYIEVGNGLDAVKLNSVKNKVFDTSVVLQIVQPQIPVLNELNDTSFENEIQVDDNFQTNDLKLENLTSISKIHLPQMLPNERLLELYLLTKEFSVAPIYSAAVLSFINIFSGYQLTKIRAQQKSDFYMHNNIAVKLFAAFHFWILILQYVLDDNSMRLIENDGVSYFEWNASITGLNHSELSGVQTLATITQNPDNFGENDKSSSIHDQKFDGIDIQTLYYSLLYLTIPIACLSGYGFLWLITRLCCFNKHRLSFIYKDQSTDNLINTWINVFLYPLLLSTILDKYFSILFVVMVACFSGMGYFILEAVLPLPEKISNLSDKSKNSAHNNRTVSNILVSKSKNSAKTHRKFNNFCSKFNYHITNYFLNNQNLRNIKCVIFIYPIWLGLTCNLIWSMCSSDAHSFFKNFIYLLFPLAVYFTIENIYKGYNVFFGKKTSNNIGNQYANFGNRMKSQTSLQTETFEIPTGLNNSEVDLWSRVDIGNQGATSSVVKENQEGFQVLETNQTVVSNNQ